MNNEADPQKQMFRYWVEIRDLRDGTTRKLPLTCITKVHLATKKNDIDLPNELELHVQDGERSWVALDIPDLSAQLRAAYPDGAFERELMYERDLEAEQRRSAALESLIKIVARQVVDDLLQQEQGSTDERSG